MNEKVDTFGAGPSDIMLRPGWGNAAIPNKPTDTPEEYKGLGEPISPNPPQNLRRAPNGQLLQPDETAVGDGNGGFQIVTKDTTQRVNAATGTNPPNKWDKVPKDPERYKRFGGL